jgi:hypothetical protein
MRKLFALMAIATVMTAVACNNSADTAAAAAADSTRIADSTARATEISDSIKAAAAKTTIIDSVKVVDSTNDVKTKPMETGRPKMVDKGKMNELDK